MHIPVLQKEVIQYLDPKPNENFIDATCGEAGHASAILERNAPEGKILGIELDSELYKKLKEKLVRSRLRKRVILVNDSYLNLKEIIKRENFKNISGILLDLGLSSWHLEESGRGFSFLKREPLDMRYDLQNPLTAEKIVSYWSVQEIEKILKEYGEEKFAKEIAEKIVEERKIKPLKNTFQLVEIIRRVTPPWYHHKKIHFATRTFQALRIAVNDELNNLEKILPQVSEILKPGGRLTIISFHSLEDRIVKNFYKNRASIPGKGGETDFKILTKKPVEASREEIKINPRSRSAKLRAAIKL